MDIEWVPAKRVWEAVGGRRWGSAQTDAVRRRAAQGVPTRAKTVTTLGRTSSDYGLPDAFWRLPPQSQDWENGDFSTVIEGSRWDAIGVEFGKAQLELSGVPLTAQAAAPASEGGTGKKGGAKGKVALWHDFWFAAMKMLDEGDLDGIQSQAELSRRLLSAVDDRLSVVAVKPVVARIWYGFLERE